MQYKENYFVWGERLRYFSNPPHKDSVITNMYVCVLVTEKEKSLLVFYETEMKWPDPERATCLFNIAALVYLFMYPLNSAAVLSI